jgi:hypothetical protein
MVSDDKFTWTWCRDWTFDYLEWFGVWTFDDGGNIGLSHSQADFGVWIYLEKN